MKVPVTLHSPAQQEAVCSERNLASLGKSPLGFYICSTVAGTQGRGDGVRDWVGLREALQEGRCMRCLSFRAPLPSDGQSAEREAQGEGSGADDGQVHTCVPSPVPRDAHAGSRLLLLTGVPGRGACSLVISSVETYTLCFVFYYKAFDTYTYIYVLFM